MSGTAVTIQEMQDAAIGFSSDINLSNDLGNIIDVGDSSDVLGLNMLANQAKISIGNGGNGNGNGNGNSSTVHIPTVSRPLNDIELAPLEPFDAVTLDMGSGGGSGFGGEALPPLEIHLNREPSGGTGAGGAAPFSNQQTATGPGISLTPSLQRRDPEQEKKEKIEYLNKLQRLEAKGFPVSKRFTMDNNLEEIKQEFDRLVDARNLEGSLRFQRQALMGIVTGLEWLNNRFDPFDLNLDGWSESVHENQEDFDEIFEELYDKYKGKGNMPPEARLLFAVAGSGFMCHVSNTFLRSKMPSADDILRRNPELARQFAAAAATQAGSGFGNFMGMAMGMPPQGQPAPQPQMQGPAGPQATGAFFNSSAAAGMPNSPQVVASVEPPRQTARREMRGPSGVDDILKTFEEVRRAEVMGGGDPLADGGAPPPMMSSGIPNAMNPSPAIVAAMEMESLASGDFGSTTESTRTGRRGGRRKAAVGNTLSLNV
jgi:hypothetical protein